MKHHKIYIKILFPRETEYRTFTIFVTKKTFTDTHKEKCMSCVKDMQKNKWIGGRSKLFADHIAKHCTYSEKLFRWYLRDMKITYIHSWKNNHRIYDFYLPKFRIGIELDGKEFHNPIEDLEKDINLRNNTITIARINSQDAILYPRELINFITTDISIIK